MKVDGNILYLTIEDQHQVYAYTREGKVEYTLGSSASSSKQGEFFDPGGLTIDDKSQMYICDRWNDRIQKFIKNDTYIFDKLWGKSGTANGEFKYPYSIYYGEETLYIGDAYCVQLFQSEGRFLQRIGDNKSGKAKGQFNGAWGIVVVKNRMYVSDSFNQRIQVFERTI